jgi:hypothetical protein
MVRIRSIAVGILGVTVARCAVALVPTRLGKHVAVGVYSAGMTSLATSQTLSSILASQRISLQPNSFDNQ